LTRRVERLFRHPFRAAARREAFVDRRLLPRLLVRALPLPDARRRFAQPFFAAALRDAFVMRRLPPRLLVRLEDLLFFLPKVRSQPPR